jgi:HEAT repeat protein
VAQETSRSAPISAELHDAAEAQLDQAEQAKDPILRAHAIEARQDVNDPAAQRAVMNGLDDPMPVVRFSATMAAGRLRIAAALPFLKRMVKEDPSQDVQVAAIFALYELGDKQPAHALEKLAFDNNPEVRSNTALVIGLMGNATGLRVLHAMAGDVDWTVRQQVADSRWLLGDTDGLSDLVTGTVSKFPDEQIESIRGLAAPHDARVAEHVRKGLSSQYPEVAMVAARALGELGSDEGYAIAAKGAKSADPRQRALAAFALGAIGKHHTPALLGELIKDSDQNVRVAAATAILELKQ